MRSPIGCVITVTSAAMVFVSCVAEVDNGDGIPAPEEAVETVVQPLADGTYAVPSAIAPANSQIVFEFLSNSIPSYPANIGQNQWWFCGHAAVATAINHLRQTSPTQTQQITQLQWFHDKLGVYQSGYSSVAAPPTAFFSGNEAMRRLGAWRGEPGSRLRTSPE